MTNAKTKYKPTLYLGLVTVTILACLTVFHFSKITVFLEKPKIYPLSQFKHHSSSILNLAVIHDKTSRQREYSSPQPVPTVSNCKPKKNLFFLKTHKTASTSVQNIILRYAESRNLTVALPVLSNSHVFPLTEPFNRSMLKESPWGSKGYNILCHHLVYNENEVEAVLPRNSVFFTIIRDPVALFESTFEYMNLREKLKMTLEEFSLLTTKRKSHRFILAKAGNYRNFLMKDFGMNFSQDEPDFELKLSLALKNISSKFDLVMLAERFDESLILLRKILCWDIPDMVSFQNNARRSKYRTNITSATSKLLRSWNRGDQIIYNFFKEKFEVVLMEATSEFNVSTEVEDLHFERKKMLDFCIKGRVPSSQLKNYKFWTDKVLGYRLKTRNSTCQNLVKPERQLTNELRLKQLYQVLPANIANQFQRKMTKNKDGEINFKRRDLEMVNNIFLRKP